MRKIFLMFLMGMFLLSFASAVAEIEYSVYEGIIETNGGRTNTNNGVSNFEVEGYVCLDAGCTTLGNEIDLNEVYNGNDVVVKFPTTLMSQHGYILYFYKDGFIGWEQYGITYAGTGSTHGGDVYLSQLRTGYAPIQNMNVVNEVHKGMPLEVDLTVGIDADTYSAIKDNSVTGFEHEESVETEVLLEIFDDNDNLLYTETKVLNIPYSESFKIEFDYVFSETGEKEIKLTTDVTDDKILNSVEQSAEANVRVIEQGKTNYSYSIVNGLEMDPLQPKVNETVDFEIDYASKYVNIYGAVYDLGTDLEIIYTLDGGVEDTETVFLATDGTYNFDYVFTEAGLWKVEVIGTPNPQLGNDIITDSRSLVFHVFDNSSNNTDPDPDPNPDNDTNVTYEYNAYLTNLEYTTKDLEAGDKYGFVFDYWFENISSDGNVSLMEGILGVGIMKDGNVVDSFTEDLEKNDTYYYDFEVEEGNYSVILSLCPIDDFTIVGNCVTETLTFEVTGNSTDPDPDPNPEDDDDDDKDWDDDSGFDFGPAISINHGYDGIELGKKIKGMPQWLYLIFLLLSLCLIIFTCIVVVLWMKKKNSTRRVRPQQRQVLY